MGDNRRVNIKALVLGVLTDFGGSLLVGAVSGAIVGIILSFKGTPQNEMDAYLNGPIVLIAVVVIGWGFTILGGFIAGRVAKRREILHGGIVGFIGILLCLLFWASTPLSLNVISLICIVPCGMFGGHIAKSSNERGQ